MRELGITRRYVRALFDLAIESGVTHAKKVLADLHWFDSLLAEDDHLRSYLTDPRVSVSKKKATLEKVLAGDLQDLTRDFFLWVVERGRASLLTWAAHEYEQLLRDEQQVAVAEVTSAARLESDVRKDLVSRLEKVTGRKIKLVSSVDQELLGGFRVRIGSMLYDGTLLRQLEEIRTQLNVAPLPEPVPADLGFLDSPEEDAAEGEEQTPPE